MRRPADSWASAMSTTAKPFGSHAYKPCGSSTLTAPPRVRTPHRGVRRGHSRPTPRTDASYRLFSCHERLERTLRTAVRTPADGDEGSTRVSRGLPRAWTYKDSTRAWSAVTA